MDNVRKTILFTYPTLFNPERGGIERVTDILSKALINKGYRVLYIHNKKDDSLIKYDYPAPIFFFPFSDYRVDENFSYYHQFLKEQKVDIIINQCGNFNDSTLYLSLGSNLYIKTISVLHSNPLLNYDHLSDEILKKRDDTFLEKLKLIARHLIYLKIKKNYLKSRQMHFDFLFQNSDLICLLSNKYKKELSRAYPENLDKVIAINNPNSFIVNDFCEKKEKIILYVGRLTKGEKCPDRLLKIWKKIYLEFPDWSLVIVGDGKERKSLERDSKKMDRIFFEGFQPSEPYYQKSSIFCMTSNYEGFPMVLSESMQYGMVPIAFNSFASVTDIIEHDVSGLLIEPFNLNEYAFKLRFLMKNEDKRRMMAKNAYLAVKKYNIDSIIKQWEVLFQ